MSFLTELKRRKMRARSARWFVAEFLVVLTGVLAALALNAWWNERQDRALERVYLLQLLEDLAASEAELAETADRMLRLALHSAAVGHAFWDPASASDAELLESLRAPLSSTRSRPVLGTAQALVATGDLRLIRSDRLRSELMSYLEWSQARVDNIVRLDETYFRPGIALLRERFDALGISLPDEDQERPVGALSVRGLSMAPATGGEAPFPVSLGEIMRDAQVYRGYGDLLVGHRNQGFEYRRMSARSRFLRGLVHQELYGVTDPGNCQLEPGTDGFTGSCGGLPDGPPALDLELGPAEGPATGLWRSGWQPVLVASGRALSAGAASEVEIEADVYGRGVIRTSYGWFRLENLDTSPFGSPSFRIAAGGEAAGSDLDAAILQRARELLAGDDVWDRQDDRTCTRTDGVLSLYCALRQATLDVTGGFHHRRPALQAARGVVAERSAGRGYEHRLRDYNNDARTSLADLHGVLDQALARMTAERP